MDTRTHTPLRQRREELGLDQGEIAAAAQISRPYYSEIETGKRKRPSRDVRERLAPVLQLTPEELDRAIAASRGGSIQSNARELPEPTAEDLRPGYAWAACGDPRDPQDAPSEIGYEPIPEGKRELLGPRCFFVAVEGNSMEGAGIRNGNTAWVNPDLSPRPRQPVLVRIKREDGTFGGHIIKRFMPGSGPNGQDCLQSDPGDGTREQVDCGEFQILGVVKWIVEERPPT